MSHRGRRPNRRGNATNTNDQHFAKTIIIKVILELLIVPRSAERDSVERCLADRRWAERTMGRMDARSKNVKYLYS